MPIYRDKARGRLVFEFDRQIAGERIRARKILPKAWTRAQADAFDRAESAKLYAVARGVERPEPLIEAAVGLYLEERVPLLKSSANVENELLQMHWAYVGKPMSALPDVCKQYADIAVKDNGAPLAPATLRNRMRYLTSACRYAWKYHGLVEHDPAARVIVPTVRNERRHFIDRAEMLTLARACKDRASRAAIRIAFYSAMRMGEILRCEVDGDVFVLADTKNGEPRHVPIHPKIRCCATMAMPDQSTISRHFRAARAAVGMDWLHFHDLRHSAASAMINAEIDLYTVGAVLGHKSAQSTKRYAHLATQSLRKAVGQIGRKVPTPKIDEPEQIASEPASMLGGPPGSRTQYQRIMSPARTARGKRKAA